MKHSPIRSPYRPYNAAENMHFERMFRHGFNMAGIFICYVVSRWAFGTPDEQNVILMSFLTIIALWISFVGFADHFFHFYKSRRSRGH